MNHISLNKKGLDIMQSHSLNSTCFGQYQLGLISCAGVTGRWGLLYLMHSGGMHLVYYYKVRTKHSD